MLRTAGLLVAAVYAALIAWAYASQPQSGTEAIGGIAFTVGVYRIDEQAFQDGVTAFRQEKFPDARAAFERADPAHRDARTQFYIAYSFYREGWRRFYHDDVLFKQGLDAVNRAIDLAPDRHLVVDDAALGMRSADELRSELERGLRTDASDFSPVRVFTPRK